MTLFIGGKSILLIESAEEKNVKLRHNIQHLERQQDVLLQEFNSLRSDPNSIMVHARSLNLYSPQDRVILFDDYSITRGLPGLGEMINHEKVKPYDDTPLKIISLSLGGIFLLFLIIRRGLDADQAKR